MNLTLPNYFEMAQSFYFYLQLLFTNFPLHEISLAISFNDNFTPGV